MATLDQIRDEIAKIDKQIIELKSKQAALHAEKQPLLDALALEQSPYKVGDRFEQKSWERTFTVEIIRIYGEDYSNGKHIYFRYMGGLIRKDGTIGKIKRVYPPDRK